MKKDLNLSRREFLKILGVGAVMLTTPAFVGCAKKVEEKTIVQNGNLSTEDKKIAELKIILTEKLKEYELYKAGNEELVYNYVTYNNDVMDIDDIFIAKEITGRLLGESFYSKDTSVIDLYANMQSTPEAEAEILATKDIADSLISEIDDDLIGVNSLSKKQVATWMYQANLIDRHGLLFEPSNFRNTSVMALQISIMENLYSTTIARAENFNDIKRVAIDESKLDGYYRKPIDIIEEDPILRLKPTVRNLEKKARYNINARVSDREANEALKRSRK